MKIDMSEKLGAEYVTALKKVSAGSRLSWAERKTLSNREKLKMLEEIAESERQCGRGVRKLYKLIFRVAQLSGAQDERMLAPKSVDTMHARLLESGIRLDQKLSGGGVNSTGRRR